MSNNGNDEVELKKIKKTRIIKIPLHYQNLNNENQNLHMSLNKFLQSDQKSKLKIGFNQNLRKELKSFKTSSCVEKNLENPFQDKITINRHFDFLRNKYQNFNNIMNDDTENKNDNIPSDENHRITFNKPFKINLNLKNKNNILAKLKQTRNEKNENIDKIEGNNSDKVIMSNNLYKKKLHFKMTESFFEKFYNQKDNIYNKQRNYSVENTDKNKSNGFYNFLSRTKISNLPIVITNNSNLNINKNSNTNSNSNSELSEKEKYEKLTETFLKIKCLLSLDCEPGKEREYIKNFFKKFGYNIASENNITNFLNFLNIEPFPLDPNKSLKDNILLAMNYQENESDYDIDNNDYDSDNNDN